MEYFGVAAFIIAIFALAKAQKLERLLRENGIGQGSRDLGRRLADMVGQSVTVYLDDDTVGLFNPCRVLDADETWALLLENEGKKDEQKKLIRLADVRQLKVSGKAEQQFISDV